MCQCHSSNDKSSHYCGHNEVRVITDEHEMLVHCLPFICVHVSSMDVIHPIVKGAATVVGGQSNYFKVRFVKTLEDNPQGTKYMRTQFFC